MCFRSVITALLVLLSCAARGQTLHSVTNSRMDVSGDPIFTLSGPEGDFRFTYTVTAGGLPLDVDDGSTFLLEVWAADGFRVINQTNTTGAEVNPSLGQVRFIISDLPEGVYRFRGVATPAGGDTNLNWNFTHHYLTVTSAASSASASVTIPSFGYTAATSTPGHVRIYSGDNMATGTLDGANLSLYLPAAGGDGVGIVSSVVESTANSWDGATGALTIDTNAYLLDGSASVNGSAITNGAVITVSGGSGYHSTNTGFYQMHRLQPVGRITNDLTWLSLYGGIKDADNPLVRSYYNETTGELIFNHGKSKTNIMYGFWAFPIASMPRTTYGDWSFTVAWSTVMGSDTNSTRWAYGGQQYPNLFSFGVIGTNDWRYVGMSHPYISAGARYYAVSKVNSNGTFSADYAGAGYTVLYGVPKFYRIYYTATDGNVVFQSSQNGDTWASLSVAVALTNWTDATHIIFGQNLLGSHSGVDVYNSTNCFITTIYGVDIGP